MDNMEIRMELLKKNIKYYQLAELLGVSEFTLSRKLRKELPESEKRRILEVIKNAR